MLFERGTRPLGGWFATHPPLLERIRALDPGFDPRDLPAPSPLPADRRVDTVQGASAAGLVAAAAPTASPLERAGEIARARGARATRGRARRGVPRHTLARFEPARRRGARAVRATSRRAASSWPSSSGSSAQPAPTSPAGCSTRSPRRAELRLPVLELALPTLRQRPREQLAYLSELLVRVQELEKTPRLFDFVLVRVLKTYLNDLPGAARSAPRRARGVTARFALGRARPAGQRRSVRQ